MITSAPSRWNAVLGHWEKAMFDRLGTALGGEEASPISNSSRSLVLHSPSTTLYLTRPEALRLLDELEMALDHPDCDSVVVTDVEMPVDEAWALLETLQKSLKPPTPNWVRFGF